MGLHEFEAVWAMASSLKPLIVRPAPASLRIAFAAAALGLFLSGCGYRGPVQIDKTEAAQQTTATAESGQGKPEGAAQKPHKGFVLDGLLR